MQTRRAEGRETALDLSALPKLVVSWATWHLTSLLEMISHCLLEVALAPLGHLPLRRLAYYLTAIHDGPSVPGI